MRTLLALRSDGRQVVAIAGNHDNQHLLDALYRPVLGELGLHLLGTPKRPDAGGTLTLRSRRGETVNVAALPFLSRRYAVRAAEVLLHEAAEHTLDYSRRVAEMIQLLTTPFSGDAVNIVMAHVTLLGGRRGGGERDVQTTFDYELPASLFPATAHYAALGHLHRQQEIDGRCPIFYSGSPLAIDFGEEANEPVALVVTAEPGIRAEVRPVRIAGGRVLRTVRGTLDEVVTKGEQAGEAYLRVVLCEPARAGLGDLVRDKLPNALEVQLDEAYRPQAGSRGGDRRSRAGRSPLKLFGDYLAEQNIDDPRLSAMFTELLDEITGSAGEAAAPDGDAATVPAAVPAAPAGEAAAVPPAGEAAAVPPAGEAAAVPAAPDREAAAVPAAPAGEA